MPNWCQNTLTISGDEKAVNTFIDTNRNPDGDSETRILSFESAFPTPTEMTEPGRSDWYNWRVENWGTKWDASITDTWARQPQPDGTMQAILHFDTAWSPPIGWLEHIADDHPDLLLRLDYAEHGMGYTGYAIAEDGYFADHEQVYEGPASDTEAYF